MFHVHTGCDTVSSFVGYGKGRHHGAPGIRIPPQLNDALLKLSCAPYKIPEDVMLIIEIFAILLYNMKSTCTDIDKAKQRLFTKRTYVKTKAPTRAALE